MRVIPAFHPPRFAMTHDTSKLPQTTFFVPRRSRTEVSNPKKPWVMNINESQTRSSLAAAELAGSARFLLFYIFIRSQTKAVQYTQVRQGTGGEKSGCSRRGLGSLNHRTCNQADVFRASAYISDFLQ